MPTREARRRVRQLPPERAWDLAFALCMVFAVLFALWKCPYGFGGQDETFYLAIPYRLCQGDFLFTDEWHLSQLSGLLILPFVWGFCTITGGTQGIVLAIRYVYIVFHALVSLCCYLRLKKYGWAAVAASVCWFLFTPLAMMTLSYNTMGLDFLLLAGVLLATGEKPLPLIFAGLCLAASVLCCPYLAGAYFLYAAAVGVFCWRRAAVKREDVFAPSRLLWLTVGAALAAGAFVVYVLCTCGIGGIMTNLPEMLSDPEHPVMSPFMKLGAYAYFVITCHRFFWMVLLCYLALLVGMWADRRRKDHRAFYLIASCAAALATEVLFLRQLTNIYYSSVLFPLSFVGLTAYLLCEEKPTDLFVSVYLGGIAYSVAVTFGSNQYFHMISAACAVTGVASILFLGRLLRELKARPDGTARGPWLCRGALAAGVLIVAAAAVLLVYVKAAHCYWDEPPAALTCQVESGPARGVRTTQENAAAYEEQYADLETLRDLASGEQLLVLSWRTWCYLAVPEMGCGAYSAWLSGENQSSLERLERYYAVNPAKVPDHIYMPATSLFDQETVIAAAQAHGYHVTQTNLGCHLYRD